MIVKSLAIAFLRIKQKTKTQHCVQVLLPLQVLEREQQKIKGSSTILKLNEIRILNEVGVHSFNLSHMKKRTVR